MAVKLRVARWGVYLANINIAICGLVLIVIAIWTIHEKSFVDELLRNGLYMNTTYVLLICSCSMTLLSVFGCFAAFKEVKCLLLTHFILALLLFVCLLVGGVFAYVFKQQVGSTMKAEMIADIRQYDPLNPEHPVTRAWDQTQTQLSCCGLMTEQVTLPWQMWRYNRRLNPGPENQMVPSSCCRQGLDCTANNTMVEAELMAGDCLELALEYVKGHANTLASAAVTSSAILILGMVSSFVLFKTIV